MSELKKIDKKILNTKNLFKRGDLKKQQKGLNSLALFVVFGLIWLWTVLSQNTLI